LQEFLAGVKVQSGGDIPEDYVGAMEAVLALAWRPTALRGVVWIADAPAHGRRYCGRVNHQDEEEKLEPLVSALADLNAKFQGFSIKGGANMTFTEMKKIYEARNPALSFKFQDFRPEKCSVEVQAKTMGEVMSATLRASVHEFLSKVPANRQVALGVPAQEPRREQTPALRKRAVTFVPPR
jgi:hypothetical protein